MSEKVKIKIARNVVHLPAIALRGLVVFPNNVVHFEVGRTKSIAAIEAAMHNNSSVFLVAQREMDVEEPALRDLYGYGVIAEIKQVLRVSEDLVKVLVEGKTRARLLELDSEDKYLQATVRPVPVRGIAADKRTQVEALVRSLKDCFEEYLSYSPQISKDVVYNIISSDSPLYLSEYMPANLLLKYEDKQVILNESTLLGRLEKLLTLLRQECQVLEIERDLDDKVNAQMDKGQREYYLREQMHIISEELGDSEDTRAEADTYREKIRALALDEESTEKLLKECDRLARMQGSSAESGVIRSYLDACLALPWHTATEDDLDQAHARKVLDREHYGLQKVKERILELLAVTYARVHAEEYGIAADKFKNTDLHIHAPEGAVPKDGPSAGVTLTTALISALSGIPVNHDLAMTGEITLHGNVLPIGGLKEKSMAAFREGISTVLIPRDNESDLYEVDAEVKEKVHFIPVGSLSEMLKHALVRPGRTHARAARSVPQATSLIANEKPADAHKEPAAVM